VVERTVGLNATVVTNNSGNCLPSFTQELHPCVLPAVILVAGTQQTSSVVLLTLFPWTTDRQSAFFVCSLYLTSTVRRIHRRSCIFRSCIFHPSTWSSIFRSCIFHPCNLVLHFQVLHFLVLHFQRPQLNYCVVVATYSILVYVR